MKKKSNASAEAEMAAFELMPSKNTSRKNSNGKHAVKSPSKKDIDFTDELDNRELLKILSQVRNGDFSARMPNDKLGLSGKICDVLNEIIFLNEALVEQLNEARNTIGKQGHLNHRGLSRDFSIRCEFAETLIEVP